MNADPNSEPEPGSEAARINETYGVQATNKWKTPKSERDAKVKSNLT